MSDYEDYEIIQKRFGSGGSGTIHKARDPNGRLVALKVPNKALTKETINDAVIKAYQVALTVALVNENTKSLSRNEA